MVGCLVKANCQLVEPGPVGGVVSKGSQPVFTRVSEKTTENSERLGQQVRPGIEPGPSRLLVLERRTMQPLVEPRTDNLTSMPHWNPRPLVQQPTSLTTAPLGRL